jgi:hypothetical protein
MVAAFSRAASVMSTRIRHERYALDFGDTGSHDAAPITPTSLISFTSSHPDSGVDFPTIIWPSKSNPESPAREAPNSMAASAAGHRMRMVALAVTRRSSDCALQAKCQAVPGRFRPARWSFSEERCSATEKRTGAKLWRTPEVDRRLGRSKPVGRGATDERRTAGSAGCSPDLGAGRQCPPSLQYERPCALAAAG